MCVNFLHLKTRWLPSSGSDFSQDRYHYFLIWEASVYSMHNNIRAFHLWSLNMYSIGKNSPSSGIGEHWQISQPFSSSSRPKLQMMLQSDRSGQGSGGTVCMQIYVLYIVCTVIEWKSPATLNIKLPRAHKLNSWRRDSIYVLLNYPTSLAAWKALLLM